MNTDYRNFRVTTSRFGEITGIYERAYAQHPGMNDAECMIDLLDIAGVRTVPELLEATLERETKTGWAKLHRLEERDVLKAWLYV